MRIGPHNWNCVDIESAGVPRGGPDGRVDWFRERAEKHGLFLCWNRLRKCFVIYTVKGRKTYCQYPMYSNDGKIIPFTRSLLHVLIKGQSMFGRLTPLTYSAMVEKAEKEREYKIQQEAEKIYHDLEVRRETEHHIRWLMGQRKTTIEMGRHGGN